MSQKNINPAINKGAFAQKSIDISLLAKNILAGDITALSKAITLVESSVDHDIVKSRELLTKIYPHSKKTNSLRIAISGSPGAGKSSFIEALLKDKTDNKFAILTIDPSSSQSHGSILGDKTRMESLVKKDNVFIRPTAAGKTLGGVSSRTREVIILCEAAGFDRIIVETVGVGQSETAVSEMVDLFVLLILAGSGDEVQGIKRGIMELADIIVVTKADGERVDIANASVRAFKNAIHLYRSKYQDWNIPVIPCSSVTGYQLDKVWNSILDFEAFAQKGRWKDVHRQQQHRSWYENSLHAELIHSLMQDQKLVNKIQTHRNAISQGREDIWNLLGEFLHMS